MALHDIVRIGRVLKIHDNFRCTLRSLDTMSDYLAVINPSPFGASLPEEDSLVYFYNTNHLKRVMGIIHDGIKETDKIDRGAAINNGEENDGNFPDMQPGDVFVGKYGRAYFYKSGDIRIGSWFNRSEIFFDDNGDLDANGLNFNLHTKDDGVSIYTTAPTLGAMATSLFIDRDINDLNISRLLIDDLGKVSISVGDGTAYHAKATFDVTGEMGLLNDLSGLELKASGAVNLYSGGADLLNSTGYLSFDPSGTISIGANEQIEAATGKITLEMLKEGSLTLTTESGQKLQVGPSGTLIVDNNIQLQAPTVLLNSASISLGSAPTTFAVSGAALIATLNAIIGLINSHIHPVVTTGSAVAQTGVASPSVAQIPPVTSAILLPGIKM